MRPSPLSSAPFARSRHRDDDPAAEAEAPLVLEEDLLADGPCRARPVPRFQSPPRASIGCPARHHGGRIGAGTERVRVAIALQRVRDVDDLHVVAGRAFGGSMVATLRRTRRARRKGRRSGTHRPSARSAATGRAELDRADRAWRRAPGDRAVCSWTRRGVSGVRRTPFKRGDPLVGERGRFRPAAACAAQVCAAQVRAAHAGEEQRRGRGRGRERRCGSRYIRRL